MFQAHSDGWMPPAVAALQNKWPPSRYSSSPPAATAPRPSRLIDSVELCAKFLSTPWAAPPWGGRPPGGRQMRRPWQGAHFCYQKPLALPHQRQSLISFKTRPRSTPQARWLSPRPRRRRHPATGVFIQWRRSRHTARTSASGGMRRACSSSMVTTGTPRCSRRNAPASRGTRPACPCAGGPAEGAGRGNRQSPARRRARGC